MMVDAPVSGGIAAALMLKDLKLAMGAAHDADASVPMGGVAETLYQAFTNGGAGSLDFSAIIQMLEPEFKAS